MVYIDETWCNALMEKPMHGLKKTQLAMEELLGDHKGLQNMMNTSVCKGDHKAIWEKGTSYCVARRRQ